MIAVPDASDVQDAGTVALDCDGNSRSEVLVPSGVNGMHIALTEDEVYWSASQVFRTPKGGGSSEVIDGSTVGGRGPFIDSNRLYWGGESMTVYGMRLDTPNATPTLLATHIAEPDAWTVSGDTVYFATGDVGASTPQLMMASALDERAPVMLVEQITESSAMAADATGVYWYDDERFEMGSGFIRKYTLATGQVSDFARVDVARFIRTGGGHVVWTDSPSDLDRETIVWSNTPDGSQPVRLGSAQSVYQLAIAGTNAYFAGGAIQGAPDGMKIVEVPLAGGPATIVACGVHDLYSLAVDEHDVFYSTWLAEGSLNKIAKP
jgi:hypothetical protein